MIIALLFIVFSCIAIELIGRAIYPPTKAATLQHRHSEPAYMSTEFLEENTKALRASVLGETFTGQWFTLIDGWRVVQGQPQHYNCTIWLFGNSTVFGYQAADGDTIADKLQQLTSCRVENRGVIAASVSKTAKMLRDTTIGERDVVVFVDGALEVIQAYQVWHRDGDAVPFPGKVCFSASTAMKETGIYKFFCEWTATRPAERAPVNILLPAVAQYREGLEEVRTIVAERGLTFIHILQPYIMTADLTPDEWQDLRTSSATIAYANAITDTLADVRDATYTIFPETVEVAPTLDAARMAGALVYLDCCHVNATGADVIAKAIYATLAE